MAGPTHNHTVRRYDDELRQLIAQFLHMGELVIKQLGATLNALKQRDAAAADRIIRNDQAVDETEVDLDQDVIDLLACLAPVGPDLRLVMMVSKGISDLEHIGDEICKVAALGQALYRAGHSNPGEELLADVHEMGSLILANLDEVLAIFDRRDPVAAKSVVAGHPSLDQRFQASLRRLMTYVLQDSRSIGHVVDAVSMLKALERIGDYAKDIAECVVFLVEGEDIRDLPPAEACD